VLEKPVFASLRGSLDIETIKLEEALELFNMPRTVGETDDFGVIKANYGRFGPYIQYGNFLTFAFFLAVPNVGTETTIKDLNFAVIEGFYDAFGIKLFFGFDEC
jgi:DNA topoisomerase-1